MGDRLRALWDFDDLDATEQVFVDRLAGETTDDGRSEVLTQLARVEGLRDRFEEGERLIDEAESLAGSSTVARARVDLERGRLRRSSGNVQAALPLFESAFALALEANELFLAVDAAHMAALAAPDREGFVGWTERGIALAEPAEPEVRYWLGPLLNNLGWELYDAGDHKQALIAFQRALAERERDPDEQEPIALARYAVAKTLRALGRVGEALPLLEQASAWADGEGEPDGWYHEELAETYAAVGRAAEATEEAKLALALLEEADPSFREDAARVSRLRSLAGVTDSSRS
jgi:tetratricopeptide (TPR) repeat protein